ncbi:hypothetical protein VW29_03780 [Devosia limi DSM 17137]|uniref:histidine kinase n=1 Tax=Devosia limi DSM 17137 TaxID=1121477 RepID=A0A0F5LV68_9HYPH|nr:ATP-binding protein [Devosia limi]KKB86181.1 hypothetical protein VW29_03780 [Devosia limi DSM 17137]SHF80714.1 two-component system, OmpR family, sensor histidine kinase QseC [Devosia limi DSM 17137]
MTLSIRARLFAILMVATSVVWLSAVAWIYFSTTREVERVLDARLSEAARMVSSLVSSREITVADAADSIASLSPAPSHVPYDRQLSCQLWSFDGDLVGRSDGAPTSALSEHNDGFAETIIDGERWRVFAIENAEVGVRVLVGDSLALRDRLVGDVIKGLLIPAALILPLMAAMILVSVNRGLRPVDAVAAELTARGANALEPISGEAPQEIRPMLSALNDLLERVRSARERERNFTAFAAHELRTPLTGLRTQAQIASRTDDPVIQRKALDKIVAGVDRTARMVRQLLSMSTVDATNKDARPEPLDAEAAIRSLVASLVLPSGVEIEGIHTLAAAPIAVSPAAFDLMMRNLLENAIAHSPANGVVRIVVQVVGHGLEIKVSDEGPGMDEDELKHATERFFRGKNHTEIGSGLGLSIVESAALQAGGSLTLANRLPHGLVVTLVLPRA